MKKGLLKASLVVLVATIFLGGLLGWAFERKGTVNSAPMTCYTEGQQVICFDGNPAGDFVCEQADDTTVLCLASK